MCVPRRDAQRDRAATAASAACSSSRRATRTRPCGARSGRRSRAPPSAADAHPAAARAVAARRAALNRRCGLVSAEPRRPQPGVARQRRPGRALLPGESAARSLGLVPCDFANPRSRSAASPGRAALGEGRTRGACVRARRQPARRSVAPVNQARREQHLAPVDQAPRPRDVRACADTHRRGRTRERSRDVATPARGESRLCCTCALPSSSRRRPYSRSARVRSGFGAPPVGEKGAQDAALLRSRASQRLSRHGGRSGAPPVAVECLPCRPAFGG